MVAIALALLMSIIKPPHAHVSESPRFGGGGPVHKRRRWASGPCASSFGRLGRENIPGG
jgi:hypothetical protein